MKVAGIEVRNSDITFFAHKINVAFSQKIKPEFLKDVGFQSLPNVV